MNNRNFLVYVAVLVSLLFLIMIPICYGADSQLKNERDASSNTNKVQSQVAELQEKYAQEEQEELDRAQKDADTLVAQVRQRANDDVDAMPTRCIDNAGSYPAENANFADNVADIRQKEEARVKEIYDQLPKQQEIIKQTYEKKISGLTAPANIMSDKGAYQLNSADTNVYVRNYNETNLVPPPIIKATRAVPKSHTPQLKKIKTEIDPKEY